MYDNDKIVPKNTSVIVSRVPVQGGIKNKNSDKPDLPLPIDEDHFGLIRYDRIVKNADLVNANSTEEDKVKAMITQSSQEYDPSKYVNSRGITGPLPPSYACFRCGKQGHWVKNCPINKPDVKRKRSTGIPHSFMVPVDGPEHKGALLTTSGDYAVPLIDHQAYKEVKKEKPPFVPQDEPVIEPEPQLPEELLCMVCNDLLVDAVLIPCCGNSFCDECVRQVLLESDNHECPVCHENKVSPSNLIPNRFLRTAVANFKNERGKFSSSSMAKRAPAAAPKPASPVPRRVDSPQPSPDSTVESQSHVANSTTQPDKSPKRTDAKSSETKEAPVAPATKGKGGTSTPTVCHTPENCTPKRTAEDDPEDAQLGTLLADEPPVDVISHLLPIQTIGHEHYSQDRYEHSSRNSRSHRDDYEQRYHCSENHSDEPCGISTIETVTNIHSKCKFQCPVPVHQQFLIERSHREDQSDYDQEEYHGGRYEKRNHERSFHRNHYERSDRESWYTSSSHDYASSEHDHSDSHYDVHQHKEGSRWEDLERHHADRYWSPPFSMIITPSVPPTAIYPPLVPAVPPIHPAVILPPQVFVPQPPPPGASPINTAQIPSQPPPPGVGSPLLLLPSDAPPAFGSCPFEKEDPNKDQPNVERSIDDRMEEFQRKLEKRDREFSRDSRSRSRNSDRSRFSARSRSFKSWTRSQSRSSTRTSRSRTRSRSWSKKRSYSRSRSRTRTKSQSRARRRGGSRDRRQQWSPRSRGRSHSFSPKSYRHSGHQGESYSSKHLFNPTQYPAVSSYQSQYGPPPPSIIPLTVMQPPAFPPHHLHSLHPPPIQHMHSRPIEPYPPVERSMKYPPSYSGQYQMYDVYSQKYQQPNKYDREQRFDNHSASRYDRRSEYPRNEEVHHRIPGWVGDRSRDYKPRYRQSREVRGKEIRELPHIPEVDIKVEHAKESSVIAPPKKKEEKVSSKHKKHHHHHRSKESKKSKSKTLKVSAEEHSDSAKIFMKTEPNVEKEEKKMFSESDSKTSNKVKGKKHKHKKHKHKTRDQTTKKKKSSKKDKVDHGTSMADGEAPSPVKTKVKKKKLKRKTEESVKDVVEEKV